MPIQLSVKGWIYVALFFLLFILGIIISVNKFIENKKQDYTKSEKTEFESVKDYESLKINKK